MAAWKLSAFYEYHHQWTVTAQHSLFMWGQTSCDVYVTCTASWRGHALEPHVTPPLIHTFSCFAELQLMFFIYLPAVWFINSVYFTWGLIDLQSVACLLINILKTNVMHATHCAYRKSSLLNYAFACSSLATSELASKWSYHWAWDDRQKMSNYVSEGRGAGERKSLAEPLENLNSSSKNCNQYPYSPRIILNGSHSHNPFALIWN